MLWWMCGVTKNEKIRNVHVKVTPVTKKITEKGQRARAKKDVRCTSTRKETEDKKTGRRTLIKEIWKV